VLCEPSAPSADPDQLRQRAAQALLQATGLSINVQVLPPGGVPRSEGKAVRVVDRRPS
jgi:phenylacetate-CoA ligase